MEITKSDEYLERLRKHKHYKKKESKALLFLRMDANKELRKNNVKWFRLLDALFIIMMIMNFGALFITGVLVMKAAPNHELKEANPAQCEWNGWSCHEDAKATFLPTIGTWIVWGLMIIWYVANRYTVYDDKGLWLFTAMIILLVTMLGADFINDLGLYIGKMLYATVV